MWRESEGNKLFSPNRFLLLTTIIVILKRSKRIESNRNAQ